MLLRPKLSKRLLPFARFNQREVSCLTMVIFLTIAEEGDRGISQAELVESLDVPKASISRNCCLLGTKTQKNKRGMDLVRVEPHPDKASMNLLTITESGRKLNVELAER